VTRWAYGLLSVVATTSLAGCGAPTGSTPTEQSTPGPHVAVVLTDDGCKPSETTVSAGTVTFDVTNTGSGAVTELELQRNGRILAEKENIAPGLNGHFSITLTPGSYELYCPGGSGPANQPLTVHAAPSTSSTPTTAP
jgi:iron uptake system component EfeO